MQNTNRFLEVLYGFELQCAAYIQIQLTVYYCFRVLLHWPMKKIIKLKAIHVTPKEFENKIRK